ncbi:MAG: hypothetical protein M3362_18255 [Acidobacteriota bacterium]|nr:hypothetical protein [Acidobacteriota bacterium]
MIELQIAGRTTLDTLALIAFFGSSEAVPVSNKEYRAVAFVTFDFNNLKQPRPESAPSLRFIA